MGGIHTPPLAPVPFVNQRYVVHEKLGAGGMGEVYRATDALTGSVVALKRMLGFGGADLTATHDAHEMRLSLTREFRTLASLNHPNIITVLDYGFNVDGTAGEQQPYFTMRLLAEAHTIVEAALTATFAEKSRYVIELLGALAYLHRRGIVHRDLKPANVLVDQHGRVCVVDFGLSQEIQVAAVNEDEDLEGTLAYLAPERINGQPGSVASDLYAVGIIIYEIFTGKFPFDTSNYTRLIMNILQGEPNLSVLDLALIPLVGRLLHKDPSGRYESAEAILRAFCLATDTPLPPEDVTVRESYLKASTFVGRENEIERLQAALDGITRSHQPAGSAWLIGGESGVGKSRLIDEFRVLALVAGTQVLRGQAVESGGLSYQVWREPIRQLVLSTPLTPLQDAVLKEIVPDIAALRGETVPDAALIEERRSQQRLALTVADLLRRQTRPIVLLLEDMQWAVESLELLKQLCANVNTTNWLIVATYRSDEAPDLPETLGFGTKLPHTSVMPLGRLDRNALSKLTALMLGEKGMSESMQNLLLSHTEGNVFFLVEVLRELADQAGGLSEITDQTLPRQIIGGGIRELLQRRLRHIPDWATPLLQRAAVAGRQLDLHLMERFMAASGETTATGETASSSHGLEQWLTVCGYAAVIEREGDVWRFSHDKLREAVSGQLAEAQVAALHGEVAAAIEAAYPDDPSRFIELADHWYAAGDQVRFQKYAVPATEQLRRLGNNQKVVEIVGRVLPGLELQPEAVDQQIALLNMGAAAYMVLGNNDLALVQYERSQSLARASGDQTAEVDILNGLGEMEFRKSNYERSLEYEQQALQIAQSIHYDKGIGFALLNIANNYLFSAKYAEAEQYYAQAIQVARGLGNVWLISRAMSSYGHAAYYTGDYPAAAERYLESLTLAQEIGDRAGMGLNQNNLGMIAYAREELDQARERFLATLHIYRELGDRSSIGYALNNLGVIAEAQDDATAAHDFYQQAFENARSIGDQKMIATGLFNLGTLAENRDEFLLARDYYGDGAQIAREIADNYMLARCLAQMANMNMALEDERTARAQIREAMQATLEASSPALQLEIVVIVPQILRRLNDYELAAEYGGFVSKHPASGGAPLDTTKKLRVLLQAHLTPEQLETAWGRGEYYTLEAVVELLLSERDFTAFRM